MTDRLWLLLPEVLVLAGAVVCAINGVSRAAGVRRSLPIIAAITLAFAWAASLLIDAGSDPVASEWAVPLPGLAAAVVPMAAVVGIVLVMVQSGVVDRRYELAVAQGRETFDPLRSTSGEYWVFFLLSLGGLMLTAAASDLIWLFLALELTSLPTYVMVAMGRHDRRAQEAAMKYFFLGAASAALFLFGFAMLYGATGTMSLVEMAGILTARAEATGSIGLLAIIGLLLSIVGVSFKLAAAPLHLYAADVYEGAATPVTAFLGFVPKAAGAIALMLLLSIVSEAGMPLPVLVLLWVMAVLTMTLGNIAALLQQRIKRMLACSSIAHSGYLLIGIIAGEGDGYAAVLIYLLAYGLSNTATFAVLASLRRGGGELEDVEDLAGLRERHGGLAWAMAISAGSLLGFPPLLGFWGKLLLFIAGVMSGHLVLVVIAGINSAISAWYYLRLVALPLTQDGTGSSRAIEPAGVRGPIYAAVIASILIIGLPLALSPMLTMSDEAVRLDARLSQTSSQSVAPEGG